MRVTREMGRGAVAKEIFSIVSGFERNARL